MEVQKFESTVIEPQRLSYNYAFKAIHLTSEGLKVGLQVMIIIFDIKMVKSRVASYDYYI